MATVRWARLRRVASCGLRLGAWYPVAALSATEVQVHVHGRVARVPRAMLDLREAPPHEWSVVRGPFNLVRVPVGARDGYVVCPNCRHRETIPETRSAVQRCPRCNGAFAVAWDRPPDSPSPAPATLRRDSRKSRRRSGVDRRIERRASAERRSRVERRRRTAEW